MNKERLIIYPVLVILASILIGLAIVGINRITKNISDNWEAYKFTYEHPNLVKGLNVRYASGSAELEHKMAFTEPTAQDNLIQAVADQVKVSKP